MRLRIPYRHCLAALAMATVLSGCASLSQGECLTGDWYALGRNDGSNGLHRSRLFDHHQACAEYGVGTDPAAYDAGREAGLLRYCTPEKGFTEGREGRPYRNVCPLDMESRFLPAYRSGSIIHDAQEALEKVGREISSTERRIDHKKTSDDERAQLLKELRRLRRDYAFLDRELARLSHRHTPPHMRY